jgi:hypothetical protein
VRAAAGSSGPAYYVAKCQRTGTNDCSLWRQNGTGGSETFLVQYSTGVANDTTFTLRLTVTGQNTATTLRMSVNGSPIGSDYVDNTGAGGPALNSGKPGLYLLTAGAVPIIDDFASTAPIVTGGRRSHFIGGGVF